MRDRLFIRIGHSPAIEASWIRLDDASSEMQEPAQGSLEQAALECTGCRVIVLVPGIDVILTSAIVPSRNRQRIASAIPYILEDQFATDVDDLHFATRRRDADGRVNALVVDRSRMDKWLLRLREAGIEPDFISTDIMAVPEQSNGWSLVKESGSILVRTGLATGFANDVENLPIYIVAMLTETADDDKPEHLHITDCSTDDDPIPLDLADIDIDVVSKKSEFSAIEIMANSFNESNAINLLQGNYSRREQLGKFWRPWRLSAAMAAMLMLTQGGLILTEYFSLSSESAALQKNIKQTYLDTFPDAKKVVNPRVQMERRLEKLRGGKAKVAGGFLDLFADAGDPLVQSDNIQLQRISYRDGSLDLSITIPNLQDLDQLKNRLSSKSNLSVEIQSATARGNETEARLQIKSKDS